MSRIQQPLVAQVCSGQYCAFEQQGQRRKETRFALWRFVNYF